MTPNQLSMFDVAPAVEALPVWERITSPIGRIFTQYLHRPSGYVVRHCGHPTANFPYYIETPQGPNILAPNGRGFQRLDLAKQHVEAITADPKPELT
jgi:hypothetical protein